MRTKIANSTYDIDEFTKLMKLEQKNWRNGVS